MLRHLCRLHCSAPLRSTAVATATAEGGLGEHNLLQEKTHRILAACILQRNPVVLRKQSEFEKAYDAYREALQYEYSRGVFDIMTTHKREMARVQDETSADLQEGALAADHTARQKDTPSRAKDSLALPALYPAYEEAEGQLSNIKRKLDRKIYLVVKDENGHWRFPSHHVVSTKTPLHKVRPRGSFGRLYRWHSVCCTLCWATMWRFILWGVRLSRTIPSSSRSAWRLRSATRYIVHGDRRPYLRL